MGGAEQFDDRPLTDWYRAAAQAALTEHLAKNVTNTIARDYVVRATNVAIDAFEDEIARQAETKMGYAVILGVQPMLVCPTRRIAKQQMTMMRRLANGEGVWRVAKVQVVPFPPEFGSL